MKIFFVLVILAGFFFIGWFSIVRQQKQTPINQFDQGQFLSGMTQGTGKVFDPIIREKEFEKFGAFLLKIEKKYQTGNSFLSMDSYIAYLEEAIRYTYENRTIYDAMRYPFIGIDENIKYMKSTLSEGKGVNYGPIAQIIVSIHGTFPNPKEYPQAECAKYLMEEEDLGKYFSDLSLISYSKYKDTRLFNMSLNNKNLSDLYNSKGLEGKTDDEMPLEVRISRLIVSDILFFQGAKNMTLEGIADALACTSDIPKEREGCLNLKKALKERDKDFIVKKFENNSRKYDLDHFFVLYLMSDLDKKAFVDKVCLIN